MTVLDTETGTDAAWDAALGPAMLPAGKVLGHSVGWHQTPAEGGGNAPPRLWLHAAVGAHTVACEVASIQRAIEDNAWSTAQLIAVGEMRPDFIPQLIISMPHCINVRDPRTGDTVLHHVARARRCDLVSAWFGCAQSRYTPILNNDGDTPVQVAIRCHEKVIARTLWRALAPSSMNAITSPLLTDELALLASTVPELVPQFLRDVERAVVRTLGTFRSELSRRAEVLGLATEELPEEEGAAGSARDSGATPSAWAHAFFGPHLEPKMLVACKVVMMPELLGKAGPFHKIVERCNAAVFESMLMELVVQSKWETNVWPKLKWIIIGYANAYGSKYNGIVHFAPKCKCLW